MSRFCLCYGYLLAGYGSWINFLILLEEEEYRALLAFAVCYAPAVDASGSRTYLIPFLVIEFE